MIIQRVIKGIPDLADRDVDRILKSGIICNWWRLNVKNGGTRILHAHEVQDRLNEDHLSWHQNQYEDPHPSYNNEPFKDHTPFISTTAGTVEQDTAMNTHHYFVAWYEALRFATNFWQTDGWLFHAYVFVLGKKSIELRQFAEELRELNIYTRFSPFHPEGEITAKIIIPTTQIEKAEFYRIKDVDQALANGKRPSPSARDIRTNSSYQPPEKYVNLRGLID